ncbi:MAG TPA: helix-turn-helix domain-containing protein [Bryobacteraceae bacterium]|jgi:AcrR family transcriptional regulator|nr:helix-turn-helix domain-containing protein [Bryobacteraceae bacterium]
MPRTAAATERLKREQRARILDAARSTFIRKGVDATMDDIAAAANVSHGLAYRYFPNKAAIIQALVMQAIEASPAGFGDFETPGRSPEERLIALVTSLVESRRCQPELYLLMDQLRHSGSVGRKFASEMRKRKAAFLTLLKRLIIESQARGAVPLDDPDRLVVAVCIALEGLTAIAFEEPELFRKSSPEPEILLRMLIPWVPQAKKKVKK